MVLGGPHTGRLRNFETIGNKNMKNEHGFKEAEIIARNVFILSESLHWKTGILRWSSWRRRKDSLMPENGRRRDEPRIYQSCFSTHWKFYRFIAQ
jgi:hypothetical protein